MKCMVLSLSLFLLLPAAVFADCGESYRLLGISNSLEGNLSGNAEAKRLLTSAIQLCPTNADAHNNLGVILEEEGNYDQAMRHYQKALQIEPDMAEAWCGIGDVYRKTRRPVLALKAYAEIIGRLPEVDERIRELMASNEVLEILNAEEGEVLDGNTMALVMNIAGRTQPLTRSVGWGKRALVEPEFTFRNIRFDVGSAVLRPESYRQLREIGIALRREASANISITGHTDKQPFRGLSRHESDRRNVELSRRRAGSVTRFLTELGISGGRMRVDGAGPFQPLDPADTPEAYARNRRVVIRLEK